MSKRHKTNVPSQVKLLDIPLQIIERYKYLSEDKLVFRKINYWTMCRQLKKVMAGCGIEKHISYHYARRTLGALAFNKGIPIESVSRVLGHANIVTIQIYAKITTQKLDSDLAMFDNKLNASFGSIASQPSMAMKRSIITMDGNGNITLPINISATAMSEWELCDLFGVTALTFHAGLKALCRSGVSREYGIKRSIRVSNNCCMEVYNLGAIVTLVFHIGTFEVERVCSAVLGRLYLRKEKTNIFFSLNTNGISKSEYFS